VNPGPAGSQNLLVEFTPAGQFVSQFQVDPGPGGGAFGLAIGSASKDSGSPPSMTTQHLRSFSSL